jgi:hypothetical protein
MSGYPGCGCGMNGFSRGNKQAMPSVGQLGIGIRSRPKIAIQSTCCGEGLFTKCETTKYGCCPDNNTTKKDLVGTNCKQLIGGCLGTQYGCCPGSTTTKMDSQGSNCNQLIGGCAGTRYGCCPGSTTARSDFLGTTCPGFCNQCQKPRQIPGTGCFLICPKGEGVSVTDIERRLNNAVSSFAEIKKI